MISFDYAPAIPITYPKINLALSRQEQEEAAQLSYITADQSAEFRAAGSAAFNKQFSISPDLGDWRNRIFLIWFCFIFERMHRIPRPLAALEEIFFEFQGGPADFDKGRVSLAALYAGAAAREPLSPADVAEERRFLEPYYIDAAELLENYRRPDC